MKKNKFVKREETKDILVMEMEELINLLENTGTEEYIKEKALRLKESVETRINFYENYMKSIYPFLFSKIF